MKRRIPVPLLIVGAITIAVVVAFAAWSAGTRLLAQSRPATIVEVSGTVLYSPAGDPQWVTARRGMTLQRGDQLLTVPPAGSAVLHLDDGSVGVSLDPDTLVTLTASWNPLRQEGKGGVHLSHGTLVAITQKDLPKALTRFCIDTEAAEVTIESTFLTVQVLKDEPTTRVSSLEGKVRVRAKPALAALYRPDAQRLPKREAVVRDNETLLVYVQSEPTPTTTLGGNLGRVVDASTGKGQPGVVVHVVGWPELFAVTDADGYFTIHNVPGRSELVVVGATDEVEGELELRPDVGRLTGQVIDASSGEGVPEAQIIPIGYPELGARTGLDGHFVLDEVPVGTHSLTVDAPERIGSVAEATINTEALVALQPIVLQPQEDMYLHLPIILVEYPQYP